MILTHFSVLSNQSGGGSHVWQKFRNLITSHNHKHSLSCRLSSPIKRRHSKLERMQWPPNLNLRKRQ